RYARVEALARDVHMLVCRQEADDAVRVFDEVDDRGFIARVDFQRDGVGPPVHEPAGALDVDGREMQLDVGALEQVVDERLDDQTGAKHRDTLHAPALTIASSRYRKPGASSPPWATTAPVTAAGNDRCSNGTPKSARARGATNGNSESPKCAEASSGNSAGRLSTAMTTGPCPPRPSREVCVSGS